ncbi:hypothetical protein [Gorillibacterium sp. sgz500922]|uniref:hypothetical protein n=1 Tax=Gorillibacterium sp. sgz500922 TaxID=3446694 RepID=UPI003F661977
MKPTKPIAYSLLSAALVLGAASYAPVAHADGLVKAPPQVIQPYSNYNGYTYLMSATRSMIDNKNQTFSIAFTTQAKTLVNQIGARIQLQRWNGSTWVNVDAQADLYATNDFLAQKSVVKSVQSGSYYRASVVHYVIQAGMMEQVQEYTNLLMAT